MALFDMKEFARRGAEARIADLNRELEAIYGAFPELRQPRRGRPAGRAVINHEEQYGRRATTAKEPAVANTPRRGKRRKMSAAQRKAVGERMRKYWAARKTESAAKGR